MAKRKHHTEEEIIRILKEAENGMPGAGRRCLKNSQNLLEILWHQQTVAALLTP